MELKPLLWFGVKVIGVLVVVGFIRRAIPRVDSVLTSIGV
jgi:hypothetical protein